MDKLGDAIKKALFSRSAGNRIMGNELGRDKISTDKFGIGIEAIGTLYHSVAIGSGGKVKEFISVKTNSDIRAIGLNHLIRVGNSRVSYSVENTQKG
jgi:hypothetical protein